MVIRRILSQLQNAGFISVKQGNGGAEVIKPLGDITLFDILKAIDATSEQLFRFQDSPLAVCPVGAHIHSALDDYLNDAKLAMYHSLEKVSLQNVYDRIAPFISTEKWTPKSRDTFPIKHNSQPENIF